MRETINIFRGQTKKTRVNGNSNQHIPQDFLNKPTKYMKLFGNMTNYDATAINEVNRIYISPINNNFNGITRRYTFHDKNELCLGK